MKEDLQRVKAVLSEKRGVSLDRSPGPMPKNGHNTTTFFIFRLHQCRRIMVFHYVEICMDRDEFKRLGVHAVPLKIASTAMSHFSRSHSGM